MTDPLRDQLKQALAPAYSLERELGGGGMSRVFVAEETRFHRRVVIKLLLPELASGISAERFEREIELAAQLQEPHIVPVLTTGVTPDGLPWYTMPYVEGESLRARMDRGAVPVAETVAILRDVARALGYAHAHGIVHRDVKPENVLLSSGTAVVTDFGIAKAIRAARGAEDRARPASTLTSLGTSLGTPAYMAPEQAAGDGVDHRADLYAWGVMAYELLAGKHPFAGKTSAQQLIAAHIAETPAPLPARPTGAGREPIAAPLAALVMRCLAKDPAARPASADEVIAALDAVAEATASEPTLRRWRRRAMIGAAALAVVFGGGWLLVPAELRASLRTVASRAPAHLVVNRVVVAPFKDETGDPKLAVLGGLVADYVTEGLSRLGSLQVVDTRMAAVSGAVVSKIPRFLRPSRDRALGEETGARVVVAGSYYLEGDTLRFRARVLDAATGEVRQVLPVVSSSASTPGVGVMEMARRVVAVLRSASDSVAVDIGMGSSMPPPSLEAFEALKRAIDAYLARRPTAEIMVSARRAAALDTTWSTAIVGLAWLANVSGSFADADSALARAERLHERPSRDEQALLDVTEARARGDAAGMLAAARRAATPNELVMAWAAVLARRPAVAIEVLRHADPDRGINLALGSEYWKFLLTSYYQRGEWDHLREVARESQRRYPSNPLEKQVEALITAAHGDVAATNAELERRADTQSPRTAQARGATILLMQLATRGGRDADARRLAATWAGRLYTPSSTASLTDLSFAYGGLLAMAERWEDLLRAAAADSALLAERARAGRSPGTDGGRLAKYVLPVWRAVALVHLGRRAEALAIDSVLARTVGARWDLGLSALGRAEIAAHLGDTDRALELTARAIAEGALQWMDALYAVPSIGSDPLLLPLHGDPRFKALAAPSPADTP